MSKSLPPTRVSRFAPLVAMLSALTPSAGCDIGRAGDGPVNEYGNPLTVAAQETDSEITEQDLRSRLYAFAHDSMMGRMRGREGNMKATQYIANELQRMGVEPGGENGTYFQGLPFVLRMFESSTLSADGTPLVWLQDFIAVPGAVAPKPISGAQVVYGGVLGNTERMISPAQAAGKLVVFMPAEGGGRAGGGGGGGGRGGGAGVQPFAGAAAIATVDLDPLSAPARELLVNPPGAFVNPTATPPETAPAPLRITTAGAEKLFGRPLNGLEPGATGRTVEANLAYVSRPVPEYARNVVGIVRGSDPTLSAEFVSLGAHPDHVGYSAAPVDHDSARVRAMRQLATSIVNGEIVPLTPEQTGGITVNLDSLRQVRPARLDSISNGADDDGSGSMALLEIAEAFATAPEKPRRSLIFIWNNSEESGLAGSRWFVENPTVPRESIVANLNMDMIGRGRAEDVPGGSDDQLFVIGSYNDSRELGEIVAEVNTRQPRPLDLNYRLDDPIDWPGYNNLYGRSDHANFARAGIPIAFFFTGLHYDYHRVTDEPQYIHYPKLERITRFVRDIALEVANLDHRPVMNPPDSTPPAP